MRRIWGIVIHPKLFEKRIEFIPGYFRYGLFAHISQKLRELFYIFAVCYDGGAGTLTAPEIFNKPGVRSFRSIGVVVMCRLCWQVAADA